MSIRWRSAFRYPQTRFLLIGTGLGYLAMVVLIGFRWVGWMLGAVIAIAMLVAWFAQFQRDRFTTTGDLLERTVMLEHLDAIAAKFPGIEGAAAWTEARQWASDSQTAAAQIAEREPTLVPDLLETLYTVEALAASVAGGIVALEQVQTQAYRTLTRQQLTQSSDRLQTTHDQLQQLRDQILLAQLTSDSEDTSALPTRLQLLIEANKTTLQGSTDESAP